VPIERWDAQAISLSVEATVDDLRRIEEQARAQADEYRAVPLGLARTFTGIAEDAEAQIALLTEQHFPGEAHAKGWASRLGGVIGGAGQTPARGRAGRILVQVPGSPDDPADSRNRAAEELRRVATTLATDSNLSRAGAAVWWQVAAIAEGSVSRAEQVAGRLQAELSGQPACTRCWHPPHQDRVETIAGLPDVVGKCAECDCVDQDSIG
jgi:hypothetical protein